MRRHRRHPDPPLPRDHGVTAPAALDALAARRGPVRVYSPRPHVQARVALELGELRTDGGVPADALPGVLARLLGALSRAEADQVVVVHESDGPVWVETASTARHRLSTPWLPRLLANGGAQTWFQPIVDLVCCEPLGREALVRATVDGRLLSGREIVGAASAHGLLAALDQRARADAIAAAASLLPAGEVLCVNVAVDAVDDPRSCLRPTWEAAREAGLRTDRLCLELVGAEHCADRDLLRALRSHVDEQGALVALDDLGAGWSSMSVLRDLLPEVAKLDPALTFGLSYDATRQRVVSALVDHAHEHGVRVVAHGVEDPDDLVAAAALGVDGAQGYLVGPPAQWADSLSMTARAALARLH